MTSMSRTNPSGGRAVVIVRALNARRCGSGWMAKCPAHDDHKPSLSIQEKDGKVLVHCHGGCSQGSVIDALSGLGLWQPEAVANRQIVAAYGYTDEHGKLLYEVVRYEPKDFKQRRPDGWGSWDWKKGERQVLYRLPEVLEAPIVFLVEGEKDVETLREYGFVATTNAGGADAKWCPVLARHWPAKRSSSYRTMTQRVGCARQTGRPRIAGARRAVASSSLAQGIQGHFGVV